MCGASDSRLLEASELATSSTRWHTIHNAVNAQIQKFIALHVLILTCNLSELGPTCIMYMTWCFFVESSRTGSQNDPNGFILNADLLSKC